jgi:hypothetical protein
LPLVLPVFNEGSWHGPWEVSTFPEGFSSEKSYTPGTPCGIWTGVYTFIAIAYLTVYARIFKYLRCHPGIAVYMNVFGKTFRKFRDFFVWFFLILVMFTTAYYFEYANTGGNTWTIYRILLRRFLN